MLRVKIHLIDERYSINKLFNTTAIHEDELDIDQVVEECIPDNARDMFKNLDNLQDFIRSKTATQVTKFLSPKIM